MIDRHGVEQFCPIRKTRAELRRVLLSERLRGAVRTSSGVFEGVEVKPSDLDGLGFRGPPGRDTTAWELRHLAETPFALVTAIEDGPIRKIRSILKRPNRE